MSAPRITLDILAGLYPAGGIGRYVRDLCTALMSGDAAPPYEFVYPRDLRGVASERCGSAPHRPLAFDWLQLRALYTATAPFGLGQDRLFGHPSVVHSPAGYGPPFRKARLLLTIHDLTAIEHPEWHPARTTLFLRAVVPAAARSAHLVICDSEHVRGQVVARFGIPRERTVTVPLSVSPAFRPMPDADARRHVHDRFGLEGEFVLQVGTLEPRKNHVATLAAFEALRRAGYGGPLVLVGQDGWRHGPIRDRIDRSPAREHVRRIRDATDADLVALYSACTLMAFPSLEEGFGLPVLEALACGAPCLTSTHPALVELVGDAAVRVDAGDDRALGDAMIDLWRSPERRERLAGSGIARAAPYTFGRWAARMFEIYAGALGSATA